MMKMLLMARAYFVDAATVHEERIEAFLEQLTTGRMTTWYLWHGDFDIYLSLQMHNILPPGRRRPR